METKMLIELDDKKLLRANNFLIEANFADSESFEKYELNYKVIDGEGITKLYLTQRGCIENTLLNKVDEIVRIKIKYLDSKGSKVKEIGCSGYIESVKVNGDYKDGDLLKINYVIKLERLWSEK